MDECKVLTTRKTMRLLVRRPAIPPFLKPVWRYSTGTGTRTGTRARTGVGTGTVQVQGQADLQHN